MPKSKRWASKLILVMWSVIFTALTGFMGAAPLRALRLALGPAGYWFLIIAVSGALLLTRLPGLGLIYLSLAIAIGLYAEAEEKGHGLFASGGVAVLGTSLLGGGAFAFWIAKYGTGWYTFLLGKVEALMAQLPQITATTVTISAADILAQVPSVFVALLTLGIFVSLLLQDRLALVVGLKPIRGQRLIQFSVHESFIWVFVLGLAGSFLKVEREWLELIGVNLLNICVFVFVLQGLAVVAWYFERMKVSQLWQLVLYVVLVTQLFLALGVIGLLDYWMNFRERFAKRMEQLDRET